MAVAVAAAPLIFRVFSARVDSRRRSRLFRSVGTTLSRIFLIQILFYGLTGMANAFLNSRRRFFAAAWSPILPNLIIIATLLSLPAAAGDGYVLDDVLDDTRIRLTLGLGATIGIASMAIVLIPAAYRAGLRWKFVWKSAASGRQEAACRCRSGRWDSLRRTSWRSPSSAT